MKLVANAPVFADVADKLLSFLDGSVLAAHNVRFDHGFIKAEFKRIGIHLRQKVLCTVKLSRLLYPQYKSHGLDAIMQRHHLTTMARHRAMGDVEVMLAFLESAKLELGEAPIFSAAAQLMHQVSLPSHLNANLLEDMPETPGVYLFYGENDLPLYIGKSRNIRARVLSHFSGNHSSSKEKRFTPEIKHVEWITTAGDLSALLLESKLVKEHQPLYNPQAKGCHRYSWQLHCDANATPLCVLVQHDDIDPAHLGSLFGTFKSKRQAIEALRKISDAHQLCPRLLGLEPEENGPCVSSRIKRCKGACCGHESLEIHYLRLQQALVAHKFKSWPYDGKIGIREQNNENDKTQLHVFEHWTYLGAAEQDADLSEFLQQKIEFKFDLDTYKLLLKAFAQAKTLILQLS